MSSFMNSTSLNESHNEIILGNESTVKTEVNVMLFPEHTATALIWKYCPPVLLIVGTFGNVATILVYRRMKRGDSTQPLFLTMLAAVDLCTLYSSLLSDIAYHAFGFDLRGVHDVTCKILTWIGYSCSFMSSWLLVAMTTQRAMSVIWPHRVAFLCSFRKSGLAVFFIVVTAGASQGHILYGLRVYDTAVYLDGACAASADYEQFWNSVWPWIDMSLFSLFPSVILLASNAVLVKSLRQSASQVSSMGGGSSAADSRKKVASSMTVTLISISITFLLLTSPIVITIILYYLLGDVLERDARLAARMDLAWAVTNMLWYANSAVNFLLYCLSGSRFREEFIKCVTCSSTAQVRCAAGRSQSAVSVVTSCE